jgi:integrase
MTQPNNEDNTSDDTDSTLSPRVKNRLQNLLQEDYVSEENGEAVQQFIHELNSSPDHRIGDLRLLKYISQFGQILPHTDFPLMEASLEEVSQLATAIDNQDVSPTTKRDRRVCLSKFYKTMFKVRERPARVWDILESEVTNTAHPGQKELERHYDFIFPDEVIEMSKAARNRRDTLLPLMFYCTGARLEEIRTIQLKDIVRHDTHITVTLNSQKNDNLRPTRDNHLTRCTHLLREWLENHPRSGDPEAYLFCCLQDSHHPDTGEQVKRRGDIMDRRSISDALDRLAEWTDLDKRHNPHAFRFSMATYYKKVAGWDINDIADRGGWGDLNTVRGYILDLDKVKGRNRLLAQGITPEDQNELDSLDMKKCGNCGEELPPTRDLCTCGHALTDKIARKRASKEVVMIEKNQKGLPGEVEQL